MSERMNNIGVRITEGNIREITIKEQLNRNKYYRGINDIKHPIHGIIDVDNNKLEDLLKYEEVQLIGFKKSMFHEKYKG